ncbi:MAG TPA: dihydrofolate reductase [Bacteroidales bacterium]|nr:dihydrofolate reductase [Bacteroidales bacterium]
MKKHISIIVAIAEDFGIGKNNRLLAHIPGDLPRFRQITTGHTVIMGKNTFLSLPGGALKNRRNIVITDNRSDQFEGCIHVYSVDEAIQQCEDDAENFIIGGASIYRQFLPFADKLYLTLIHKKFDADTFFPEIRYDEWNEISREEQKGDEFDFEYVILERKN